MTTTTQAWPSTTRVLRDAGFYDIYARAPDTRERGRLVHAACDIVGQGLEIDREWTARHPECLPYIELYRKFLAETRFRLQRWQWEVRSEQERYIGHPDQGGLLGNSSVLIDIKTGICPSFTALQLASYVYAEDDRSIRRIGLQLTDGRYKIIVYDDPKDYDAWVTLVRSWW